MVNQTLHSEKNTSHSKNLIVLLIVGIIILLSTIYFIWIDSNYEIPIIIGSLIIICSSFILYKNSYEAPDLILTNEFIQIGELKYDYDQITGIDLINNIQLVFDADYVKSTFHGEFKTINEFNFEERLYNNLQDIKLYIEQVAILKIPYQPIKIEYPKILPNKTVYSVRNINFYLNINVILLFISPIILTVLVYLPYKISDSILVLIFMPLWLIILLLAIQPFRRLHFSFEIVDEFFIVHSPIKYWDNKIYKLNDIKHIEIVTIEIGKSRQKGLKILTNDYKYKIYNAEGLSIRQLMRLLIEFKKMGKSIRKSYF